LKMAPSSRLNGNSPILGISILKTSLVRKAGF
jgi:hypothetical protein